MKKNSFFAMNGLIMFLTCLLLVACGTGTTASSGGNGVTPTATKPGVTPTATPTASTDFAFVRNYQVWVSMHGAPAVQATHFDKILDPPGNVFYNQPLWFDNDHYLVFMLNVLNYGIGGNICDMQISYARERGIFVLNTDTMQVTSIKVTGDVDTPDGMPYSGHWEAVFVEDATHLLAWHSSLLLKGETSRAGLYRIDVTSNTSTLVVPASDLPETTLNRPWYTMRYNNGQLFYEVTAQGAEKGTTSFTIYRHSISQPDMPSVKLMDVGTELFCVTGTPQPDTFYTRPAWDISPDGKYLVAQTWSGSDVMHLVGHVQMLTLQSGAVNPIFTQVPAAVLATNVNLSWSPDSQAVLFSAGASDKFPDSASLYSAHVAQPDVSISYQTAASGKYDLGSLSWSADSSAFALYGDTHVYSFTVGQPAGQELFANASYFAWGQR